MLFFLLCEYYGDVIQKERGRRRSSIIYRGGYHKFLVRDGVMCAVFFFVLLNINEFGGIEGILHCKMMKMKSVLVHVRKGEIGM